MGIEWIDHNEEHIAAAGWNTLSNVVALKPDAELDFDTLYALLGRVEQNIHKKNNRVSYTMNGFIISIGAYVMPLHSDAVATAERIGQVTVDMNGTACKVPFAVDYIEKIKKRGSLGKKKKTVKC
jgi:hypothetical protein